MMMKRSIAIALAAALLSCDGALLTAPAGSTLFLQANPIFVAAHGGPSGTAVVTATVVEKPGTLVPDGTVVQWFTTLGRIDPETRTRRGVATANFVSDSRSGKARITAVSGAAEVNPPEGIDIDVGAVRVARILLRANPPQITNSNTTHVIATVFDDQGNPVPNVAVFFDIRASSTSDLDFFETVGPVFTDNNGEAENIFRTRSAVVHVPEVVAHVVAAGGTVINSDPLRIPVL